MFSEVLNELSFRDSEKRKELDFIFLNIFAKNEVRKGHILQLISLGIMPSSEIKNLLGLDFYNFMIIMFNKSCALKACREKNEESFSFKESFDFFKRLCEDISNGILKTKV